MCQKLQGSNRRMSGRRSQDSESKQLKNTLSKAIESCVNYHQMNIEVFTKHNEETQTKPLHHLAYKVSKVVKSSDVQSLMMKVKQNHHFI